MARWHIINKKTAIAWDVLPGDCHTDTLEMAGLGCSDIVRYGMDENGFVLVHHPIFPTLRLRPNDTCASYQADVAGEFVPQLTADGKRIHETLTRVEIDGTLILFTKADGLALVHRCFPSTELRLSHELVTVKNVSTSPIVLDAAPIPGEVDQVRGPMGVNIIEAFTDFAETTLAAGESYTYSVTIAGRMVHQAPDTEDPSYRGAEDALARRLARIDELTAPMQLDTGNATLDTLFRFSKLRAGESVFRTRGGLMHCPGGDTYLAATWCNDQAEYSGPFFAYTGDETLIEAAANGYRMYIPYMSNRYEPIPCSVIAECVDYWDHAGDRGDAAMYLYGASRFVLAVGDCALAESLLPGIEWCAEYCRRKINAAGVVASDCDELENRFPAGDANLCTSSLAYGGYRAAAALERDLGNPTRASEYDTLADNLRTAIEAHFGYSLHGIDAYRYYEGCDVMRSWICMPLCMDIFERADATVEALTSKYLLRPDGILTIEGDNTVWDRSTLYGLRGIFASGHTKTAMDMLTEYCENRLLGERVPYPVEAYPEGGRRHLSGEAALFCKVILEGILDMKPTGFRSFSMKPTLPEELDHLTLTDIRAYGTTFGVKLTRDGYSVIRSDGTVLAEGKNGQRLEIHV
ncbi:MAG: hypothetical protein E7632_00490 [Ruminococcaceae bacterium]|nr:hypothetical protein [Oscillospiraceae bacterium]